MRTAVSNPSYKKRVGYQAMLLGGFAALATIFLVSGNIATKDAIKARKQEDLLASLNVVMPPALYDNNPLASPLRIPDANEHILTIYRGTQGDHVSALSWEFTSIGYAGEIHMIMGISPQGKILGVRVLSHAETPGLGDKIEEGKSNWILQFQGLSLGNPPVEGWRVKKDGGQFDSFSGATITPRGVVRGIEENLQFFKTHRDELLNLPSVGNTTETQES